jgi:hypothetical protein
MNLLALMKFTQDEMLSLVNKPTPYARFNPGCARYNAADKPFMMSISPQYLRSITTTHIHFHIGGAAFRVRMFNCPGPEGGSCNRGASFARKADIKMSLSSTGAAPVDRRIESKRKELTGLMIFYRDAARKDGWGPLVTGDESWFSLLSGPRRMWALAKDAVATEIRTDI